MLLGNAPQRKLSLTPNAECLSPLLPSCRCWWPPTWRPAACTSATCPSEPVAQAVVLLVALG